MRRWWCCRRHGGGGGDARVAAARHRESREEERTRSSGRSALSRGRSSWARAASCSRIPRPRRRCRRPRRPCPRPSPAAASSAESEPRPTPGPSLAVALTVSWPGTGSGLVTSGVPAGLSCGGTAISCTGWFAEHATVTLTATPEAGGAFVGWTGACSGTGTCEVSAVGSPTSRRPSAGRRRSPTTTLDVLGSVRAITDALGNVVTRHDYFPFGESELAAEPGDPHRFTGKQRIPRRRSTTWGQVGTTGMSGGGLRRWIR